MERWLDVEELCFHSLLRDPNVEMLLEQLGEHLRGSRDVEGVRWTHKEQLGCVINGYVRRSA